MAPFPPDQDAAKQIDAPLANWRQGDVALKEQWFAHVGDPQLPLTSTAAESDGEGPQALVADVAGWNRTPGCSTNEQARAFAAALARKRQRCAFPNDFTLLAKKLQDRLTEKHGRDSDEGRALRALREIRVCAAPSWDAGKVELLFFFIREEDARDFEGKGWDAHLDRWLKLIPTSGRFIPLGGVVIPLDQMTAREYVESDPLDLDHLSLST